MGAWLLAGSKGIELGRKQPRRELAHAMDSRGKRWGARPTRLLVDHGDTLLPSAMDPRGMEVLLPCAHLNLRRVASRVSRERKGAMEQGKMERGAGHGEPAGGHGQRGASCRGASLGKGAMAVGVLGCCRDGARPCRKEPRGEGRPAEGGVGLGAMGGRS